MLEAIITGVAAQLKEHTLLQSLVDLPAREPVAGHRREGELGEEPARRPMCRVSLKKNRRGSGQGGPIGM